jgi:hypothetical protein
MLRWSRDFCDTTLAGLLVVPASYFLAAILAGTASYLLRPVRRHLVGWLLTGAVVAALIYGSIGLMLAVFYNPVGAWVLENSSKDETWGMILPIAGLLSPVGALVGAYFWWRDRRGNPVW